MKNDNVYNISLLNLDLYEGLTGVCLFYYNLYENTLEEKYNEVSVKIFNYLTRVINQKIEEDFYDHQPTEELKSFYISPFYFPSSYIYLYYSCNSYHNTHNKEIIYKLIAKINNLLYITDEIDFIGGKLGVINLLMDIKDSLPLNLKDVTNQSIIDNLNLIYKSSIINNKFTWVLNDINGVNEITGFAHGSSSVYSIYYKAYKIYNFNHYKEIALMALEHDRSFYNDTINGWDDNRSKMKCIDSVAWCHGSSGIGLSRILNYDNYRDDLMDKELSVIKNNIINTLDKTHDHSICHGSLGNLEVLKGISNILNDDQIDIIIDNYLASVTESYENFIYGTIGKTEILGMFLGKTGFGYQLLRFYNWENTPSVLSLETPFYLNKFLH